MSQEAILSLLRATEINGYTVTLALVLVSPKLVTALCNGACEVILAFQGRRPKIERKTDKKALADRPQIVTQEATSAQAA